MYLSIDFSLCFKHLFHFVDIILDEVGEFNDTELLACLGLVGTDNLYYDSNGEKCTPVDSKLVEFLNWYEFPSRGMDVHIIFI
jgi:hypothetical protein